MGRHTSNITILLLTIMLFSGFILVGSEARADVIDNVDITVPASCSLSTNSGMGETYSVSMMPGQYKNDIGDTTISVFCNTNDTYAIYAIGYSNDTLGTTDMISNNTATTGDISTGTATNGSSSAWAMKLSSIAGTYAPTIENGFGNFSSVPSTYTKVASVSSAITPSTDIASVKATYAVYISPNQKVATYTGKVKYTLVHPASEEPLQPQSCVSGKICYFPNGSNVIGTMGYQSISSTATTATLLASNFSRQGYGFAGWSNKYDYATNPNQEGIKFYGPQEIITFARGQYTGSNNGLALYAIWIPSAGSLQDSSKVSQLCGTGSGSLTAAMNGLKSLNSVSALTDQRDNETYAIAKLADGKCWMIENLRLESTAAHNSDGTLAQGYGTSPTYGNFSGLADAESRGFSSTYSANSLYSRDGSNNTISIGTSANPAYRMPRYNNWNNQPTSANRPQNPTANDITNGNAGMYSYGNYYTWHAAIADLTYNGTNNTSVENTSLCPSGWRLPRGGNKTRIESNDDNDFWNLVVDAINGGTNPANYGSDAYPYYFGSPEGSDISKALRAYPNNIVLSGFFYSDSSYSRSAYLGTSACYWSSTTYDYSDPYILFVETTSTVSPGTHHSFGKYDGLSIRCMAGI